MGKILISKESCFCQAGSLKRLNTLSEIAASLRGLVLDDSQIIEFSDFSDAAKFFTSFGSRFCVSHALVKCSDGFVNLHPQNTRKLQKEALYAFEIDENLETFLCWIHENLKATYEIFEDLNISTTQVSGDWVKNFLITGRSL